MYKRETTQKKTHLHPHLCKLFRNILFPLQIPKLIFQLHAPQPKHTKRNLVSPKIATGTQKKERRERKQKKTTHGSNQFRTYIRHILVQRRHESRIVRQYVNSIFRDLRQKLVGRRRGGRKGVQRPLVRQFHSQGTSEKKGRGERGGEGEGTNG